MALENAEVHHGAWGGGEEEGRGFGNRLECVCLKLPRPLLLKIFDLGWL